MKNFAFDDSSCRVRRMLDYFGEHSAIDCGKCDVCRAKVSRPFDAQLFEARLSVLLEEYGQLDMLWLSSQFGPQAPLALAHLRRMAEDGKVTFDGTTIHNVKQC